MNKKQSEFFFNIIFIAPFSVLLWELLLLSANCAELQVNNGLIDFGAYWNGFFCSGYPQFLQHSPLFDLIFLRGAFVSGAEHWSSAMFLCIVPLIIFVITKNGRFAFWSAIFYAMTHELYWQIFALTNNNDIGYIWDIVYFLIVILAVSFFVIRRYRKIFFTRGMVILLLGYNSFLTIWSYYGFHVTVVGALAHPILTKWYLDFQTNFFEVSSWIFLGIEFIILIYYYNKKVNIYHEYNE